MPYSKDHDISGSMPSNFTTMQTVLPPTLTPRTPESVPYPLDRNTALKLHRKQWTMLKFNPVLEKSEVVEKLGFKGILHNCFLCHYARQKARSSGMSNHECETPGKENRCKLCPVVWPKGTCVPPTVGSQSGYLYTGWTHTDSIREKTELADKILNLPEKPEEIIPGFDEIRVETVGKGFRIRAYKDGSPIPCGNIATIRKDGSGMYLFNSLNKEAFKTEDDHIKILKDLS